MSLRISLIYDSGIYTIWIFRLIINFITIMSYLVSYQIVYKLFIFGPTVTVLVGIYPLIILLKVLTKLIKFIIFIRNFIISVSFFPLVLNTLLISSFKIISLSFKRVVSRMNSSTYKYKNKQRATWVLKE